MNNKHTSILTCCLYLRYNNDNKTNLTSQVGSNKSKQNSGPEYKQLLLSKVAHHSHVDLLTGLVGLCQGDVLAAM